MSVPIDVLCPLLGVFASLGMLAGWLLGKRGKKKCKPSPYVLSLIDRYHGNAKLCGSFFDRG